MRLTLVSALLYLGFSSLLFSCTKKSKSAQNSFAFTNDKTQQLVLTHISEFAFPWEKLVRKNLQGSDAFKSAMEKKWRRVCFLHSELTLAQVKKLEDSRIFEMQSERFDPEKLGIDSFTKDKKITVEDVKKVTEALNKSIFDEIKHDSEALYNNHMLTAQVVSSEAVNLPLFEKYLDDSANRAGALVSSAEHHLARSAYIAKSRSKDHDQYGWLVLPAYAAGMYTIALTGFTPLLFVLVPGIVASKFWLMGREILSDVKKGKNQKILEGASSYKIKVDEISISLLNRASIAEEARTGKIIEAKEVIDPNSPVKNLDFKKEIPALIADFKSWASIQPGSSPVTENSIRDALGQTPSQSYSVEDATKLFDNLATINASHVACPAERSRYSYPWLKRIDPDGSFVFADPLVNLF